MSSNGRPYFLDHNGAEYEEKLLGCDMPLRVTLKDGRLTESTYYNTTVNKEGKMIVAIGGNVFHLILPRVFSSGTRQEEMLAEIKSAEYAVVSYSLESAFCNYCLEVMFEDHTQTPYSVQIDRKSILPHYLTVAYHGETDFTLKIYGDDSLRVVREMPVKVRFVPFLPYGSEWNDNQFGCLAKHEIEQVAAIMLVHGFLNDAQMDGLYDFKSVARFIRECTGDYDWNVIKTVMYEAWYHMINEQGIPFERIELREMEQVLRRL